MDLVSELRAPADVHSSSAGNGSYKIDHDVQSTAVPDDAQGDALQSAETESGPPAVPGEAVATSGEGQAKTNGSSAEGANNERLGLGIAADVRVAMIGNVDR